MIVELRPGLKTDDLVRALGNSVIGEKRDYSRLAWQARRFFPGKSILNPRFTGWVRRHPMRERKIFAGLAIEAALNSSEIPHNYRDEWRAKAFDKLFGRINLRVDNIINFPSMNA